MEFEKCHDCDKYPTLHIINMENIESDLFHFPILGIYLSVSSAVQPFRTLL